MKIVASYGHTIGNRKQNTSTQGLRHARKQQIKAFKECTLAVSI